MIKNFFNTIKYDIFIIIRVIFMNKKYLSIFLVLFLCTGCLAKWSSKNDLSLLYHDLPKDNEFTLIDKKDLITFLDNGTGILTMGFPSCKWCQAYYPSFNELLKKEKIKTKYFNIYEQKKNDRSFYDQVANKIKAMNKTGKKIIKYDNDGKMVIYVPLVLFIENGKIIAFDNETSDIKGMEIKDYWTPEKKEQFQIKMRKLIKQNKKVQENNQAGGCNSSKSCKVN